MSFRGRRFRRSGSYDKPFKGRDRGNDRFHGRDFDQQYDISDRGRRGRGSVGWYVRSPRTHRSRGRFHKNRGRNMGSFRHFDEREFSRFSPRRSQSPTDWLEEESTYLSDDSREFIHRRGSSPVEWFDECDDNDHLEECTRHSNGRPISPLIRRNFEREDYEHARERSLERRKRSFQRREWSPLDDQSRSLGRNPYYRVGEKISYRRSRSPVGMRNFRCEIQGSPGRPRSQLSTYSIRGHDFVNSRDRSLERPGSQSSINFRRHRRDDSNHSQEFRRRPDSELSVRSRSFESRNLSRSPKRCFGKRTESNFSIHSRSLERERSLGRRFNFNISVRSGSLKRHGIIRSKKGSIIRSRSRSLSNSSNCFDAISYHNRPGPSFKHAKSFEKDNFQRDKSLTRCFSPAKKQSDNGRSFKIKSHSFKRHHQSQSLEHQRRYHEKRSESSIERFLNDCKQSVEKTLNVESKSTNDDTHLISQKGHRRESPDGSLRKFKGLDHIVIERGKSFERSFLPDEITARRCSPISGKDVVVDTADKLLGKTSDTSHSSKLQHSKQKCRNTGNRFSPISSKSGSVEKTNLPQYCGELTQENNLNLSPISNSSIVNQPEFVEEKSVKKAGVLNISDALTNEEKIAERNCFENRLSPISSQSGSIGEKDVSKSGEIFCVQDDFNLSPISQTSSLYKDKFSEKSNNFSPISQVECFEDDNSNDVLPTRKRKVSCNNDSMQEFLAELERDEISHDERSCSPKLATKFNEPFTVAVDTFLGGWKKVYTTKNKEQSDSIKQYSANKNHGLSGKAYFEVCDSGVKEEGSNQIYDAHSNKLDECFGKRYEQSNLKAHTEQLPYRPSQALCLNKHYSSENKNVTPGPAIQYPNISYPLRHNVMTLPHCYPQMQSIGPNPQFSTVENTYNQSTQNILGIAKPNSLTYPNSTGQLLSPFVSSQESSVNTMYSRTSNVNMFPNYPHDIQEKDKLHHFQEGNQQMLFQQASNRLSQNVHGTSYQNSQIQQPLIMPPLLPPPHSFGGTTQVSSNNSIVSTGSKTTLFHQEVNNLLPNSEMPRHFNVSTFQLPTKPLEFQVPHGQNTSLVTSQGITNKFLTTNTSTCSEPVWPNQIQSHFAGNVSQIQHNMNIEKSDQTRSNLKLVVDSVDMRTVQGNVIHDQNNTHSVTSSFGIASLNQNSAIVQNHLRPTAVPVDISKHLAPIFGRSYFSIVFPTTKEVITISDDEDVNVSSKIDSKDQNEVMKQNVNIVENIIPSSVFVEKYRDSPPSPEDLKQMFNEFVIYFGVRNNGQLEKDPLLVIQESFSRSQGFGPLHVEENEEYHDFLPVPKQACVLRWNGVLLSKAMCYSKAEARYKASIALINSLAHSCYVVQAKYSYYCGGKLPKFMLKKPEQPGIYKVVERDEIIKAVTSTLKTLKEKKYFTGKGVDATHVRVVLGIIDDYFRDKSTFCELIFGSQGQSDYTIGELKEISAHVNRLSWLEWRNIGGYGRGLYTAVGRKKTSQELREYLLRSGESLRYKLIPPQDPWIDLLLQNCQYNPNIKKFQ